MTTNIPRSNRREILAKLNAVEAQLSAKGITVPRRKMLIGRNALQERLESLQGQLASVTASASAAPVAVKTPPVAAEPVKAKPVAATDTLESLIAQHSALEAKIESLQPKAPTPAKITTPPATASTPPAKVAAKMASGSPSVVTIGEAVYGASTIATWTKTHGISQIEDRINRNLYMDNLAQFVSGFNHQYYTAILGAPRQPFGAMRGDHRTKLDRLQTVLKSA